MSEEERRRKILGQCMKEAGYGRTVSGLKKQIKKKWFVLKHDFVLNEWKLVSVEDSEDDAKYEANAERERDPYYPERVTISIAHEK